MQALTDRRAIIFINAKPQEEQARSDLLSYCGSASFASFPLIPVQTT